ncbi:hypothetical protein HPB47_023094 [Ixodes persulcatus]|uniref:Uncharacterized protein n=1 Tax=Ixodes persulcatus TaxID=34615 RepID=A0AC60Q8C7_IXOPE|nr:hypothetical protein HPB47_023094 [Ixodes persulcatus]
MAPQKTTTEHGNPPGTGSKHLLVVGTRAARQRTGKKALSNATAPTAKLSLMAAADATNATTGVNPLYTLRKGFSLTKSAPTLDQKSREDDHNTKRAPSDPTTNDAEKQQLCLVKAIPTFGEALKADDHIQLDASGHPTLQNSDSPSAADMNCHQASWSSRDPSGDDEMDQAAWSTVVSRGARKKAIAPTPMKKQPGGDGDKHDTVILRPRERVRVTELSPKDLKTALAKSIDNHSKYERCYRIRIQEVTNTIAVDTWLPHLAEHFLKVKTIRTPDKEISVSTYLALNGNQVRGVIYGIDPTDDPENLLPNLGKRTPRYVTYYDCMIQVCAYRPRVVVCTHCHAIGHKADICPNEEEQRCPDCGREHMHGEDRCMDTSPQCKNCKGAHLATDSSCPKWRGANEQLRQNGKTRGKPTRNRRRAPRSRWDESGQRDRAAQLPKGEEIPPPTPPPKTEGHFPALPKTAIAPATRGVEKKIAGYNVYMTPTIRYKKRGRPRRGSDTPNRPGYNVRSNATAWIPHLKLAAGKVPIIVSGDFNATHTMWGYSQRLQAALKESTQDIKVKEGDPTPDSHLLNLWASRIEALERYKNECKPPALRAKLNLATATAKRYANQLARQQWQDHYVEDVPSYARPKKRAGLQHKTSRWHCEFQKTKWQQKPDNSSSRNPQHPPHMRLTSDAQLDRLKTTEAGRAILRLIGYATDHLPTLSNRSLEDTTMQLTTFAPLARNMGKDHEKRRFQRVMNHIDFVREYSRDFTNLYIYTDAALRRDGQGAIGWFMLNSQMTCSQVLKAEPARPDQEQQEQSQEGENDVIPFDPDEFLSLGRTRRRKTLTDLVPQDPDGELPAEYSRSDRVILRRIRTNTAITPALQAKLDRARRVRHPDDPAPVIDGQDALLSAVGLCDEHSCAPFAASGSASDSWMGARRGSEEARTQNRLAIAGHQHVPVCSFLCS